MKCRYNVFQDFIQKLNVDCTIEICLHDPYWYLDYYPEDDFGFEEFPDTELSYYNPSDEPIPIRLTFFEQIEEKVIYDKDFDINKYVPPESEISDYILTWNSTSKYLTKDEVVPFLIEEFPEHYTNLIRSEKLAGILNDFDKP